MKAETDFITIELVHGIVEASYKPIFIDINVAKEVLKTRHEVTLGNKYPMLLNGIGIKGINKDARDYFSQPQGTEGLIATAILVNSRLDTFFANFLIKVNISKSNIPLKLFTNKTEAINWLNQYK